MTTDSDSPSLRIERQLDVLPDGGDWHGAWPGRWLQRRRGLGPSNRGCGRWAEGQI